MRSREPAGLLGLGVATASSLLLLALGGCGGDGSGFQLPPTTGTLLVTTTTAGDEPDPDGYTVQLDGEAPQPIGAAGTIERAELRAPGQSHPPAGWLAPNCSVEENPRTVQITAGQTTTSTFAVVCTATSGGVVITTVTTGDAPDPDGYGVVLDGVDQGVIPASGQLSLTALALGSHVVGLSGLAGNCSLQGDNLRAVTVAPGSSTAVDYAITCSAPPANAGSLRVITVTTGDNPDPDGYRFSLDRGENQPIGANATASIPNLAAGAHRMQLSGLSDNCQVQGSSSRTVNVPGGGSTDVTFNVSCSRAVGSIRVTVFTSGSGADPDGYQVLLDNAPPGQAVEPDGSVRFNDVPVGSHMVSLDGIASTCGVNDGASRTVPVTTGNVADVTFRVSCSATESNRLELVSGDHQTGAVGSPLPQPLVVQVVTPSGTPVSGVTIQWTAEGGGSVSEPNTITDGNGQASVTRTLGPSAGPQTTRAAAAGLAGSPVIFTHAATSNKTASTTTITSDEPEPSTPGQTIRVEFTVTSDAGAPTGSVAVTVTGGTETCTGSVESGFCEIVLNEPGSRTLIATYTGDDVFAGSSDREIHQVSEPQNSSPDAAFTPPNCITSQPCEFTDQSTDSDGTIQGQVWEFTDPTETLEGKTVTHTFGSAGLHDVKLTVTDNDGACR